MTLALLSRSVLPHDLVNSQRWNNQPLLPSDLSRVYASAGKFSFLVPNQQGGRHGEEGKYMATSAIQNSCGFIVTAAMPVAGNAAFREAPITALRRGVRVSATKSLLAAKFFDIGRKIMHLPVR
jgi:hypothetical protein